MLGFTMGYMRTTTQVTDLTVYLAERVGFEPTVGCPTPVFKTGTFGQLSHLSNLGLKCCWCAPTSIQGAAEYPKIELFASGKPQKYTT